MRFLIFVLALASQTLPVVLGPSKQGENHDVSGSKLLVHEDHEDDKDDAEPDEDKDGSYIIRIILT